MINAPSLQIEAYSLSFSNSVFNATSTQRGSANLIVYANETLNSTQNLQVRGDKILILSDGQLTLSSNFSIIARQDLLVSSKK